MKEVNIKEYHVHLYDDEKPIVLDNHDGEKLSLLLASGDAQKFIMVQGQLINKSAIRKIVGVDSWKVEEDDRGISQRSLEKKNLHGIEATVHERYEQLRSGSSADPGEVIGKIES